MTKLRTLHARQSSLIRDASQRANSEHGRTLVWAHAIAVILAITLAPRISAQQRSQAGLTAIVDAETGDYVVSGPVPSWQFRGSTGSPVQDLVRAAGRDALGPFHSIRFNWN